MAIFGLKIPLFCLICKIHSQLKDHFSNNPTYQMKWLFLIICLFDYILLNIKMKLLTSHSLVPVLISEIQNYNNIFLVKKNYFWPILTRKPTNQCFNTKVFIHHFMLSLDEIYRPLYMHKVVVSGQKKKFLANFTKKNDLLAFIHHFMLSEDEYY